MRSPGPMQRFLRGVCLLLCLLKLPEAQAFGWKDLWQTRDQQGQALMNKGRFQAAQDRFVRPDWSAAAAYRAGDYQQAADIFSALHTEDGFYNQGNALARLGQYEEAIKAYDKALAINPNNQDALFNRKLVKELMKKDKQKEQNKDQQNKDQQNKDQQNKDQQNKDQQNKDQQNKDQQNKDQQNKDQQNKDQQNKDQQNKDQQNKDQQNKDQQNKDQQDKDKSSPGEAANQPPKPDKRQDKADKNQQAQQLANQNDKEKQQEKEQWLKLIPDDPGGLLREKFLRDYLRRQHGW